MRPQLYSTRNHTEQCTGPRSGLSLGSRIRYKFRFVVASEDRRRRRQ